MLHGNGNGNIKGIPRADRAFDIWEGEGRGGCHRSGESSILQRGEEREAKI